MRAQPAAIPTEPPDAEAAPAAEADRRAGILIVDDDPRNRLALAEILSDLGEELVQAGSGEDALRQLLRRDFAVVLLDVNMPVLDGYETAALIRRRQRSRNLPIIFLTAYSKDDAQISRGYLAGAVDYVFKPIDPVILRSKVAVFVELFKKTEEVKRKSEAERQLQLENLRVETERRKIEQQLFQAQKMEAVGQLTGGIAHDFNNMLTVVIGHLNLLKRAVKNDPKLVDRAQAALQGAMSCAELTRRLLAFSRQQPLQPKAVELGALLSTMADLLRRTLGESIAIDVKLAPNVARVFVDPAQLESALLNLALNARDAMPEGGRLRLMAENRIVRPHGRSPFDVPPGAYVEISVSDTGTGMSEETLRRAFEPFYTTKPVGQGTGLGLSMIYGFAKQSGGDVRIESQAGEGTNVRLLLPKTDSAIEAPALPAEAPSPQPGAAERVILAVEDDAAVRGVAVTTLRELGYNVIEAPDAVSALEILREGRHVDVLFTDVAMPDGSGVDLAREAQRLNPTMRVLYTSGYSTDWQEAGMSGDLLPKPYHDAELADALRRILG
ncbi:MAG TPA: response regulator [Alphaproteobacteria bacterium]|nr:response regulator [Alphaproteobacteria bacterium]